jgi:beta-lactamase class A
VLLPPVAATAVVQPWRPPVRDAVDHAAGREGRIRFAVVDEDGTLHGHKVSSTAPMASVFKVMLMAAYLRQPTVRNRALRARDRRLLGPMIRWSDNVTATRIRDLVGPPAIRGVARSAGMHDFRLHPTWGLSRTSARDQARFMFELERYLPDRHERYARHLLSSIVRSQRWGIPRAAPPDWDVYFKGGWGSGTGAVTHQVAFLESGERRIAVAVLIEDSPTHRYGTRTIEGVAARLLAGVDDAAAISPAGGEAGSAAGRTAPR